jgi:hypothetical protein
MYYASGVFRKVYIVMEQGKTPLKGIRDIFGFRNWGVRGKAAYWSGIIRG